MDRNKALGISGALAMTVAAGALAIGANLGLFGLADRPEPAGGSQPTTIARTVGDTSSAPAAVAPVQAPATSGGQEPAGDDDSPGDDRDDVTEGGHDDD